MEMEMEMLLNEIPHHNYHDSNDSNSDGSENGSTKWYYGSSSASDDLTTINSPDSTGHSSSSDEPSFATDLRNMSLEDKPAPYYSLFNGNYGGILENFTHNDESFVIPSLEVDNYGFISGFEQDLSLNSNLSQQLGKHYDNQFLHDNSSLDMENTDYTMYDTVNTRKNHVNSSKLHGSKSSKFNESLIGEKGYAYSIARDQNGCRFLQAKLDEGQEWIDLVFNGTVNHSVELSMNPFGNYLMQKIIQVCGEEQRMLIVYMLTRDSNVLVGVSLNIHGTRAVQKLVETVKTKEEISLVISALEPGFLDLMKDPNGNHVIQKCLQFFTAEDNKVIFGAAAIHSMEISTHQHGCCVMQRCIAHSFGEDRKKLVDAICSNGLPLAQHPFGNYVVQFILGLKIPSALAKLAFNLEGWYAKLAMQKISSNVVEKCLKVLADSDKANIIVELLSVPRFEQILQHPYANYVVQAALQNSKGSLHTELVNSIRPHATNLRSNPFCKRIFNRAMLKK
ncbi:hypothetical protein LUZ60_004288 [Juncus effusus]|nr:hypothetical protein LUZ60_004288 [Juncus effusus]